AAGLALGAAVANHVMMLIVVPAFMIIGIGRTIRREIRSMEWIGGLLVFVLSLSVARLLFPPTYTLDLRVSQFLPQPEAIPDDIKMFLVYLLLQFPTPLLLLAPLGMRPARDSPSFGIALLTVFASNLILALGLDVPDHYVFYNLSYYVVALWIGIGSMRALRWARARRPMRTGQGVWVLLTTCAVVFPIATYYAAPRLLTTLGVSGPRLGIREIPYRPALSFFLWPPKTGYRGARTFAAESLAQLPRGAVLIADHTVAQPLWYLQSVEKMREDVEVVELRVDEQVEYALRSAPVRRVFLALTEPYYDIDGLEKNFHIVKHGSAYELVPRKDITGETDPE
ncbi:MAG: hypothetical protein ABIH26_02520, partial [Candidatus Eisenbacteria bacterium]